MKYFWQIAQIAYKESPPSRGAWIEIPPVWLAFCRATVAPLAGGVD